MRLHLLTVTLLAYAGGCEGDRPAAGAPQVGLKAGELTQPFNVKAITGPEKGKTLCYI